VDNTVSGKGKNWHSLTNSNFYFDPKGKGKGKNYAQGHRYSGNITGIGCQTPSNVPSLNSAGPIQFYSLEELENPGNDCLHKTVPYKAPASIRLMHEPIRIRPTNTWLKARTGIPETKIMYSRICMH
jgi:hypothetical protein